MQRIPLGVIGTLLGGAMIVGGAMIAGCNKADETPAAPPPQAASSTTTNSADQRPDKRPRHDPNAPPPTPAPNPSWWQDFQVTVSLWNCIMRL